MWSVCVYCVSVWPRQLRTHEAIPRPQSCMRDRTAVALTRHVAVQLLKNREEAVAVKNTTGGRSKEGKRGRYRSDESESMATVQMLGHAFQKIQAATGIHVRCLPLTHMQTRAIAQRNCCIPRRMSFRLLLNSWLLPVEQAPRRVCVLSKA